MNSGHEGISSPAGIAGEGRPEHKSTLTLTVFLNGWGTNFAPSPMAPLVRRLLDPQLRFDRGTVR